MLRNRFTPGASTENTATGWLLQTPAGAAGNYRLAQLDNYANLSREGFPHKQPASLSLRCRVSCADLPGTWGFGFWNDPSRVTECLLVLQCLLRESLILSQQTSSAGIPDSNLSKPKNPFNPAAARLDRRTAAAVKNTFKVAPKYSGINHCPGWSNREC